MIKRCLTSILAMSMVALSFAQTQVDSINIKKAMKLNGYRLTGVSNDTAMASKDSLKLITEAAAKRLIEGRTGGTGGYVTITGDQTITGTKTFGTILSPKWRFNADGSWQVANDRARGDSNGNAFFRTIQGTENWYLIDRSGGGFFSKDNFRFDSLGNIYVKTIGGNGNWFQINNNGSGYLAKNNIKFDSVGYMEAVRFKTTGGTYQQIVHGDGVVDNNFIDNSGTQTIVGDKTFLLLNLKNIEDTNKRMRLSYGDNISNGSASNFAILPHPENEFLNTYWDTVAYRKWVQDYVAANAGGGSGFDPTLNQSITGDWEFVEPIASNGLQLYDNSRVTVENTAAGFGRGDFDNGLSGNNGVSLYCAVGYELNWQAGKLSAVQEGSSGNLVPLEIQSDAIAPNLYTTYSGSYRAHITPVEILLDDSNGELVSGHDLSKTHFANNVEYTYADYGVSSFTVKNTDDESFVSGNPYSLIVSNTSAPADGTSTINKSYIRTEFSNEGTYSNINSNGQIKATNSINIGENVGSGILSDANETKVGDAAGNNSGTKLVINSDDNYIDVFSGNIGNVHDNSWSITSTGKATFNYEIVAGSDIRGGINVSGTDGTDGVVTTVGSWNGNGESTKLIVDDYNEIITVNKGFWSENGLWRLNNDGSCLFANNQAYIDDSGNGKFNSLDTDGVEWQLGSVNSIAGVPEATYFVNVTIGGVAYKLLAQE